MAVPKFIPSEAMTILKTLHSSGYQGYLVGGCVRDMVLGREPADFDICTSARPGQVKELFSKVYDSGIKYGTVTVLLGEKAFEVTTFRKGFGPWEDVNSRDFTINGLLFDGERVMDYVNGLEDLNRRLIRAVGSPQARFREDAIRMLRAVRLSCQLGFDIEQKTFAAIPENAGLLENTAVERIRDELVKLLTCRNPSRGMRSLQITGLLCYFLPELQDCFGFAQHNSHHDKDVFEHSLAVLDNTTDDPVLRLAALLHDIGKPRTFTLDGNGKGHFYSHHIVGGDMTAEIMSRIRFDRRTAASVTALVTDHMSRFAFLRKGGVKKLINRVGTENLDRLVRLQEADILGSAGPYDFRLLLDLVKEINKVLNRNEPLGVKDLAVSGRDLVSLGIEEGPEVGRILKKLLAKVWEDPEVNSRETLVTIAGEEKKYDGL
ncbi:CCA tRNA nucleotidyltransferase [Phosphitispora fastidiosa]|uniref:CCA tRNA nucleotidyltransferase n=1 Tax=Phosphitispora fastidiosa TaxID=2837202 RepID=UPI001E4EB919|nr:HDIG domain-containing metalloprotein [Phosphitispora fastidiosa]MBU7008332.1 tRNA nucleotidyltransferase (CCA-adding enzyme) [Phosphitispora fastidiosa]